MAVSQNKSTALKIERLLDYFDFIHATEKKFDVVFDVLDQKGLSLLDFHQPVDSNPFKNYFLKSSHAHSVRLKIASSIASQDRFREIEGHDGYVSIALPMIVDDCFLGGICFHGFLSDDLFKKNMDRINFYFLKVLESEAHTVVINEIYDREILIGILNLIKNTLLTLKPHAEDIRLEDKWRIIGGSSATTQLRKEIVTAGPNDASVLILGDSGTGKELVARNICLNSTRSHKPFVAINCGALNENLLEAELFGYEAGAFTGAKRRKKGLLESADGGTLFLDEVGEMPAAMQVKLLRVLQEKQIMRIGSTKPTYVDVRIIAATNRPLEQMVNENTFRQDLYYRLKVLSISIPPLTQRKDDIAELCAYFLNKFASNEVIKIDSEALEYLNSYSWPGNIRELRNEMERVSIICSDSMVRVEDLSHQIINNLDHEETSLSLSSDFIDKMNLAQKKQIESILAKHKGNKSKTAKELSMTTSSLTNKMKLLGIEKKK